MLVLDWTRRVSRDASHLGDTPLDGSLSLRSLRRTEDPHPPIPTLRAWCGLWEGGEGRALVYRYVWRDDLSDTFDESVRV